MTDPRPTFLAAAATFEQQVASIPESALAGPGLGDWDLRSLVGHTSRSLVTVETYLDQPAADIDVATAPDYYLAIAPALTGEGPEIVERGRQAGLALGADPASYVAALASRVRDKLAGFAPDYVLTTIAGGMPLEEYLRTRTFELVVHGLDLERACGVAPAFAPDALVDATTLAAEVAVLTGRGPDLLLALTGRAPLAAGFSVV
jgi:uncharacterized protein (TIGR03083 family)